MQEKNIETLVINKIESQAVYDAMEKAGKINSNELYLVGGGEGVTGVKGAKESTYRTGEVNLTAANIGALSEDTAIPSKTSDLTNDSDFATNSSVDGKLDGKVDKVTGKGLSTNDLTNALKGNYDAAYTHSTSSHAPANAERNVIVGIKKNGTALTPDSSRNVDITVPTKVSELTNDSGYLTKHQDLSDYAKKSEVDGKVDKVTGKGLSTNDYTTADKNKLSGIAENANNYSLPVATSKALGGVKSGTDITVDASGNVSVNDNSHNHTVANVTGLQDVLDSKATTDYVDTKVAGIVDSAPEALDTLNELADALGNDPNFATTVATQIGSKVDKVSGKGLSTNDLTAALKSNYDAAYTHSTTAHAPSNAERNTIVGIQKNGTDVTINSSTRKVNIIVPTKVSELTNDSGYLTQHQDLSSYAKQSDLDSKVDKVDGKGLSANDFTDTLKSNLNTAYTHSQAAHAPSNAERNTIVGIQKNGTDVTINSTTRKVNIVVPTNTSDLTNDSGFLTQHQSLANYATKTDLDGKVDKIEGKDLSTNDFDNTQKNNLSTAYTHSQAAHAPLNAERNTIVTIKKNGTALSPDSSRAINITVPTKVSELTNDSGYLTSVPVTSVNSKTGAVSLTASDVGAAPSSHTHNYAGSSSAGGAATSANKVNKSMTVKLNGGTTEGTNQFTFDGSSAKNVNITPSGIGAAAANHTHDYLPLTGGSLTGNLVVGNAGVQANGYVVSTWLQTTQTSDKAGNFATIDGDGWIYYRTPAETLADIGAASASHNHSASNITSGTISIARGGTGGATASAALSNLGAVPKSGGTMTGPLVAQTNTSYTTAQMRNVIISTADPSGGNNGDIWLKYEA